MQLFITLRGETPLDLPLAHHHQIQGMLYALLAADPVYGEFLHDEGYGGNGGPKLFTFGPLAGDYTVAAKRIRFAGSVCLEVRSYSARFIQALLTSIRPGTALTLGSNRPLVERVVLADERVYDSCIKIAMVSPITVYETVVENGFTRYFNPSEDAFFHAVQENFTHKYHAAFGTLPDTPITLTPLRVDSVRDKYVTRYKDTVIEAWRGQYRLSGTAKALDFLYHVGLGAKNAQGFGMFKVL